MQTAVFESTYPVMGGFKWHRFYYSMAATPLDAVDIVFAQLAFIAFRILTACAVFLVRDGGVRRRCTTGRCGCSPCSSSCSSGWHTRRLSSASAARLKSESGFALIFRLGLIPMFLFSGAFFPISQLGGFAWLAYAHADLARRRPDPDAHRGAA